MLINSSSFDNNGIIPAKFTCDGGNHNPELVIMGVPEKTESLALIMDDPDAPAGNFTHWLVWNIDPKTEFIREESIPMGANEGKNGAGEIGYIGPCPPDGKPHRYFFKLYALKEKIKLESGVSKSDLEKAITPLVIEKAELIGIYERPQI